MFKIEIDIAEWDFKTEKLTIETSDFDKIAIIQEFIQFQKEHGWAADYDVIESDDEVDADESVEDEECEEYEIGEQTEDEDGLVWQRVA